MPEPVTPPAAPAAAPPSAPATTPVEDINWAELFPTDPGARVPTQPATATPPATPPAAQPPVTPPPTPEFLKTSTGTVYKSADEAIKGIEHKDTLIEQLRQRYILERGIDPITNQPVQPASQAPAPYTQDPN